MQKKNLTIFILIPIMQAIDNSGISDDNDTDEHDDLNVLRRFPGDVVSLGDVVHFPFGVK